MGRLDGRVAIVTGAAHGERAALGVAFAKALAGEGARVACADIRDPASLVAEIEADGGEALAVSTDVSSEEACREMVRRTVERFGGLDILVNNAAVGSNIAPVRIEDLSVQAWDHLMGVNVRGAFLCVKAALPEMRRAGYGKIINIGSTTMVSGLAERLHYVTAKGAILAMTRSLARELGPHGIRVNTFSYGMVISQLNEAEIAADAAMEQRIVGGRSMHVHTRAEDLTGALIFLAAADSDHMTGQCLVVDAGGIHG